MSSPNAPRLLLGCMLLACAVLVTAQDYPNLGIPVTESDLAGIDLIVEPSGAGLPAGNGTPIQGQVVFEQKCQACHGASGEGTIANTQLAGGNLQAENPVKTIGSYWPHATTPFDYMQRAMPANAPKSLTTNEVYQVTAYLLYLNGIIEQTVSISDETLPDITLPNADGFIDQSNIQ